MDKLRDAIYGLAIGDAMGVPHEFMQRGTFRCKDMEGYGTHNQPAGTWSDDTAMTLATLASLKANDWRVDTTDMAGRFVSWAKNGEYAIDGKVFDIGAVTATALESGKAHTHFRSNGNGSLMRILPLAFTDCTDGEISAVSAITHGNWISRWACEIYVDIARKLLAGVDIKDIDLTYGEPFDRLADLKQMKQDDVLSTGYVVDTLEAALWSLLHSYSYESAVLRAVNLGGDTDTIGAVTGGLAGIMYGVPKGYWFNTLRGKDIIEACL